MTTSAASLKATGSDGPVAFGVGETVWTGEVQVFDLIDCPETERAYVWSHAVDDSERRRFVVVLHRPPVDSPQAAVRASVAAAYNENLGGR